MQLPKLKTQMTNKKTLIKEADYLIRAAMSNLSRDKATRHFGVRSVNPAGYQLPGGVHQARLQPEAKFQDALKNALSHLTKDSADWHWDIEAPYDTVALSNEASIYYDIIGVYKEQFSVLIELKYVTDKVNCDNRRMPSDPPAFPYDVIKDCVKLELGLSGVARSRTSEVEPIYGVSIGLTNWSAYWNADATEGNKGWARSSFDALRNASSLSGVIKTVGTALTLQARPHLSLGLTWQKEWMDYSKGSELDSELFRFVYLSVLPNGDFGFDFNYQHEKDDSSTLPLLSNEARELFRSGSIVR